MQIIKGFVSISKFINNTPTINSNLGELSTWSSTYTKEKGEYTDSDYTGLKLLTFKVINSETLEKQTLDQLQVKEILSVVQTALAYNEVPGRIRPFEVTDLLQTIVTTYQDKIYNFNMGVMVDNGLAALPEWMSWRSGVFNHNEIKIWLSDPAFADQYDDYEIEVIPPLDRLDAFFDSYTSVVPKLQERTLSELSDVIIKKKALYPDTYLRMLDFAFNNTVTKGQSINTTWVVLIYGKAGDQIDAIRDAIVDYVLANSTKTKDEWGLIFPDIFRRTEFVLLPRWDMLSIPNLSDHAALYSSIMNPVECVSFAKRFTPFYIPAHTQNHVTIFPHDYKAISIVAVDGIDNIDTKKRLREVFEDYLPVSTSTLEFNRMTEYTRDWMVLVEKMLMTAEKATAYSSLPDTLRRTVRNGITFIVTAYDNVNYLMATRASIVGVVQPPSVSTIGTPFIRVPANNAVEVGPVITFNSSEFLVTDNNDDTHKDTEWQLSMDAKFSTIVASSLSAPSRTTWIRSGLLPKSDYYVRVRYEGAKYGWSDWSEAIKFTTKESFGTDDPTGADLPIGTIMDGGYYVGILSDSGSNYRIILAPLNGGQSETPLLFRDPALGNDTTYAARSSYVNGYKATTNMIVTNENSNYLLEDKYIYPVAQFIQGMRESNFGGFNDWYIPARDELEIIYRNLKPSNAPNSITKRPDNLENGRNDNAYLASVPYTILVPGQTSIDAFKDGKSEAMRFSFWSASAYTPDDQWVQSFTDGQQSTSNQTNKHYVRAIRRVKIS